MVHKFAKQKYHLHISILPSTAWAEQQKTLRQSLQYHLCKREKVKFFVEGWHKMGPSFVIMYRRAICLYMKGEPIWNMSLVSLL